MRPACISIFFILVLIFLDIFSMFYLVGSCHTKGLFKRNTAYRPSRMLAFSSSFRVRVERHAVWTLVSATWLPGLRSELQVTRECFVLGTCSCWHSSLGTGIQGKCSQLLCTIAFRNASYSRAFCPGSLFLLALAINYRDPEQTILFYHVAINTS